jgi:hypothetical protein
LAEQFIRYGSISGELAPIVHGRSDLEKYDLGLSLALNWYIDYRGSMTTRPGTQFCELISDPNLRCALHKFVFSPDTANTYVLVFTEEKLRFVQDGAYVLEAAKAITGITRAAQGVVTSAAHGFSNGDWFYVKNMDGMLELRGRILVVSDKTTDTFKIKDYWGDYVDTSTYTPFVSGNAKRVYTVTTPYAATELSKLRTTQVRDTLRITHRLYKPRDLIRNDQADWTLSLTVFSNKVPQPTGMVATGGPAAGDPPGASTGFCVTAVDFDGNESIASDPDYVINTKDPALERVSYSVTWNSQPNVWYYNIYRTLIYRWSSSVSRGAEFGYVGRAYGTRWQEGDVIPDFTKAPPLNHNPFADSRVKRINVTAGGTGYSDTSTVGITTSTGTGFTGFAVTVGGAVVAIVVQSAGENYDPADVVTVSGGTGATFELILGEPDGNFPRTASTFQQRQVYSATDNEPITVFGSKPGKFSNFDYSSVTVDSDEYEHEIDSSVVAPIKHLVPVRGGLISMSSIGVWFLSGENGAALTPKNPVADIQSGTGAADVPPLIIGTDVLYIEVHSASARLLSYKEANKVYGGEDISLLSSHFFNKKQQIENMSYAAAPLKIVWLQRAGGSLLSFTLLREQNVYAWAQHWTRGYFRDAVTVSENEREVTYLAVDRTLNGKRVKTIERFVNQDFENVEDAWCVDCGLALPINRPAGTLQISSASGTNVGAVSSEAVFVAGDLGKIIRAAGGMGRIKTVNGDRQVHLDMLRPCTKILHGTADTPILADDWSLDANFSSVSGLELYEGETLAYLADGNVGSGVVESGVLPLVFSRQPCCRRPPLRL